MPSTGFLTPPPHTAEAQRFYDEDVTELGYVMNASRLWAYQPETREKLFELMSTALGDHKLSYRERGILVSACASSLGDSYCSLAWGSKLAGKAGTSVAASVLTGDDAALTPTERAMAAWARKVARDPNGTTAEDVQELRDAGLDDARIFAITTYVALRIAFSTVNDALGSRPDAEYRANAPGEVLAAVTWGRPIDDPTG